MQCVDHRSERAIHGRLFRSVTMEVRGGSDGGHGSPARPVIPESNSNVADSKCLHQLFLVCVLDFRDARRRARGAGAVRMLRYPRLCHVTRGKRWTTSICPRRKPSHRSTRLCSRPFLQRINLIAWAYGSWQAPIVEVGTKQGEQSMKIPGGGVDEGDSGPAQVMRQTNLTGWSESGGDGISFGKGRPAISLASDHA